MNPDWLRILTRWLLPDWRTGVALIPALLIGLHMLWKNRSHGKIAAWMFYVLLFPIIGTLSYLLFAGRKVVQAARTRKFVNKIANELTDSSLGFIDENKVTLLAKEDGTDTYDTLLHEIAHARETIHITTYILGRDAVGREIVAALARRAKAGVRVRLLVDALGSLGAKWRLCAPLEAAGGDVRRFMPVLPLPRHWRGSANLRNHRKIAIFDGQRAIIGGQNLAREYIGPKPYAGRYRDFSILVDGPAVAALTRTFLGDWCFAGRESPADYRELLGKRPLPRQDRARIEIITGGPDSFDDTLWERLLSLIQESRKQITLITPYLVPDDVLFRILLLKVRRGVRTRLILPRKSDHPLLDFARRPSLRALRRAGAEILLHEGPMLHAKLFLLDEQIAVVGSTNLDMRSLLVNFEVTALIRSSGTMHKLRALAESLARQSTLYTPLETTSLYNRALESLASILAPLL